MLILEETQAKKETVAVQLPKAISAEQRQETGSLFSLYPALKRKVEKETNQKERNKIGRYPLVFSQVVDFF